ncbi:emerin (Emery-Dreifuss muscular dystrophy) [Engraulis encrasicolus]|uniref:emerin (Emery-Dreifuss muscular dystrophy) n=1 Tax=Engraulis encrasicolus TaxID=184585 RepID=UPI002FD0B753
MSDLSNKTDKEIQNLLDEYGIKHGPIVGSTRGLYEKKLRDAMAKGSPKASSDKTYYREEEEEVEYIEYHPPPVRNEGFSDVVRRTRIVEDAPEEEEEEVQYEEPIINRTQASSYQSMSYSKPPPLRTPQPQLRTPLQRTTTQQRPVQEAAPSGGVPGWLRVLVFVLIAVFLYYVYSTMETPEENPFNRIEA